MGDLVSVIIPSFGGGQYLCRTVDSVLNQTYSNVEAIVVDDNGVGTPNQLATSKVMECYKNNSRVKYVCHEHNINGSAARNTGVKNSSAEYIALLDDDDEYYPEKIERQLTDIKKLDDSYALVYCGLEMFVDNKSKGIVQKMKSGSLFYEVMTHKVTIGSSSFLIRRHVWDELGGFDESFRRHQDWEFTARVAYKYKVYAEDYIGVKRHVMRRNSPSNPDIAYAYRKHYLDKMASYMTDLPMEQQTDIQFRNMMDICVQYLKSRSFIRAYMVFHSVNHGSAGIRYLYRRFFKIIKRGRI